MQLGGDRHEHAGLGVGVLGALEEGLVAPGELLHVFLLVAKTLTPPPSSLDKAVEAAQVFLCWATKYRPDRPENFLVVKRTTATMARVRRVRGC